MEITRTYDIICTLQEYSVGVGDSLTLAPCRIQPSLSLSLVVEVQTATDLDPSNQEIFKLLSCGWTRLELFDQHNQV